MFLSSGFLRAPHATALVTAASAAALSLVALFGHAAPAPQTDFRVMSWEQSMNNAPVLRNVEHHGRLRVLSRMTFPAARPDLTRLPPAELAGVVAGIGEAHGVPGDLFAALVMTESSFDHGARSRVGAIGFAQLMPATARELGVDPHDPWQNLEGGARYLRSQFERFGDWTLALAAYNAGPTRVARLGRVPRIRETQNYVKKIFSRAERFRSIV